MWTPLTHLAARLRALFQTRALDDDFEQELGIRMALGASRHQVQIGVILQTLGLVALGASIGVAASMMLGRLVRGLLFEVTATDPVTFVAMVSVLTVVGVLASYLPARRASRIDPMAALRPE